MKIVVGSFAFCLTKELKAMVDSCQSERHDLWFDISVHSDRADVREVVYEIQKTRKAMIRWHCWNRGLSRSLNDMILDAYADGADAYINCNDDVLWGTGDLDRLAEFSLDHLDSYMVTCRGWARANAGAPTSPGDSACVLTKHTLDTVGCWDQNLWPIYHEDVDHQHRAKLLNMHSSQCETTEVRHIGSASIYSSHEIAYANNATFVLNQEYMKRKWGPNLDWEHPFNNPAIGLRIAPSNRDRPYGPGYDREDVPHDPPKDWGQHP